MNTLKLRFLTLEAAQLALADRFPEWDGGSTPWVNADGEHLVMIPNDTIKMGMWSRDEDKAWNEDGSPDLSAYAVTGCHIDLMVHDDGNEYLAAFIIPPPDFPAHNFG